MNVGRILELYVTDNPMEWQGSILPKGTLFGSIEILNTDIEAAIDEGKYTGFSILGAPVKSVEEMDRGLH